MGKKYRKLGINPIFPLSRIRVPDPSLIIIILFHTWAELATYLFEFWDCYHIVYNNDSKCAFRLLKCEIASPQPQFDFGYMRILNKNLLMMRLQCFSFHFRKKISDDVWSFIEAKKKITTTKPKNFYNCECYKCCLRDLTNWPNFT